MMSTGVKSFCFPGNLEPFSYTPKRSLFQRISACFYADVSYFAEGKINIKHLRVSNLSVEKISDSTQIRDLLTLFQEINFDKPNEAGYMPKGAYQEDSYQYTKEVLFEKLQRFVEHLEKKQAFFGSPQADTPELACFFKHVEESVLFCISAVNRKTEEFMKNRLTVPAFDDSAYQTYQDLLQARARLVIDLAIAGDHCAGHYASSSIELYQSFRSKPGEQVLALKEHVFSLLAGAREELANIQVAHLVNSLKTSLQQRNAVDALVSYKAKLGPILGIPGTENCVKLSSIVPIHKRKFLSDFFQTYTADFIRNKVQEEIRNSQRLREEIVDWVKDQAGVWKEGEYREKENSLLDKILQVKEGDSSLVFSHISLWQELLTHLHFIGQSIPDMESGWEGFVEEVLSLSASKAFLLEKTKNVRVLRKNLLETLKEPVIKEPCKKLSFSLLENREVSLDELQKQIGCLVKARAINQVILLDGFQKIAEETLVRCLDGKADLREVLKDHLNRARKEEFLMTLEPFAKTLVQGAFAGLKADILDWILVHLEILHDSNLRDRR